MKRFLARQPIFNAERAVYGYELLYRSPGCRSFINCTRDFPVRDFATMLPENRVVTEILETIQLARQVVECCRSLKQAGYTLALDDFQDRPDWNPQVALTDFIKVDLLTTSAEDQLRPARTYLPMKIRMLAEKVETYDDFQRTPSGGATAIFRAISSAGRKCWRTATSLPTTCLCCKLSIASKWILTR